MSKSFPISLGIVIGGTLAIWHAAWSLLVALGWAQPLVDWLFKLHMVDMSYRVKAFDLSSAVMLVIVAAAAGFLIGWVAGTLWKKYA